MKQTLGYTLLFVAALGLSGCQSAVQASKAQDGGFAGEPTVQPPPGNPINNVWGITDTQAMAWLSHDSTRWNDEDNIPAHVDWNTFWSQQVHANTSLSIRAANYCRNNPWQTVKAGTNCQVYWQAFTLTQAQQSRWEQS